MCDYSLEVVASRPARVGDKLVSTTFPFTSTCGFASADDGKSNVAVCLRPGTELAFDNEVKYTARFMFVPRRSTGHKLARFRHVNQDKRHAHHDALEFPDGQILLLTELCAGQHATVLQLPANEPRAAVRDAKTREPSGAHVGA